MLMSLKKKNIPFCEKIFLHTRLLESTQIKLIKYEFVNTSKNQFLKYFNISNSAFTISIWHFSFFNYK
jgi:hypothetical protein